MKIEDIKTGSLWLGSEASHLEAIQAYKNMSEADPAAKEAYVAAEAEDEANNSHFLLDAQENVAIITVKGSMVPGSEGRWGQYWGVVGYDDIRNAIITALDAGVSEILFDYDTPGGAVKGIAELSDFIKGLAVHTVSFTGGNALSGGLWLTTASDVFYAARMAEIGSLGVIAVVSEHTEMYKEMGIDVKVYKSAALKAAGNPHEKRTAEVDTYLQENIDKTAVFFVEEIARNRDLTIPFVQENVANGKVWYAEDANKLGLIDGIKTFDEAFLDLYKKIDDNSNSNPLQIQDETMSKKKVLSQDAEKQIAEGQLVDPLLEASLELKEEVKPEVKEDAVKEDAVKEDAVKDAVKDSEPKKEVKEDSILKDQLKSLTDEVVQLKVDLSTAKSGAAHLTATHEGLKKVTAIAVQSAFVHTGCSAPSIKSLMAMDAGVLLEQHAQVAAQVAARYPGGQVTEPVQEDEDEAVALAAQHTNELLLKQATI